MPYCWLIRVDNEGYCSCTKPILLSRDIDIYIGDSILFYIYDLLWGTTKPLCVATVDKVEKSGLKTIVMPKKCRLIKDSDGSVAKALKNFVKFGPVVNVSCAERPFYYYW